MKTSGLRTSFTRNNEMVAIVAIPEGSDKSTNQAIFIYAHVLGLLVLNDVNFLNFFHTPPPLL